jgi:hypothetical protein
MKIRLTCLFLLILSTLWAEQTVTLSNLRPRLDTDGQVVDVQRGSIAAFDGSYFWYGTASDLNPGTESFSYYRSNDLNTWQQSGSLLQNPPKGRLGQARVGYDAGTKKYILWFTWFPNPDKPSIGVATARNPAGPFQLLKADVPLAQGLSRSADFDLFKDEDGRFFLVYTNSDDRVVVEPLAAGGLSSTLRNGGPVTDEGGSPSLFKRMGKYYLLLAPDARNTTLGSGVRVYRSDRPTDGYVRRNDINRFPGSPAPMLVDGVLSPNLYTTVRKNNNAMFVPIQLEFQSDTTCNTLKIIQFTGGRSQLLGDSTVEPIRAPSFELQYWKNGYWIPLRLNQKSMSSSVYTLLDFRFDPIRTRRLRLVCAKNYPSSLRLNEIEVSMNQEIRSVGSQAFLLDKDVSACALQIPGSQSSVLTLTTATGIQYIWLADLWGSASDNNQGHDYHYWGSPLEFDPKGDIETMKWVDNWRVRLP